ncbi:MAG: CBS domain-containing protein [Myxococcota bacterium]
MSVEDHCQRSVCAALPGETLRAAAQRMESQGVGSLVIIEEDQPVGVLTDRDIVVNALAEGRDPDETPIRSALGRPAVTIAGGAGLGEALDLMKRKRLRRLPVVDAKGQGIGIISADDVVRLLAEEITGLARVSAAQLPVVASVGSASAGAAAAHLEAPRPTRAVEHYQREVQCLRADTNARALAQLMKSQAVGCVVATSDGEDAVGVVTDRDLVTRVVAAGQDPDGTPVSAIMSTPPVTAQANAPLQEVVAKMADHGVRRIPILSGDRAVGLVSYDDLLVSFGRELAELGETVRSEIRHEQLGAQVEHVRKAAEAHLRDIGGKIAELGADSVESLRKELDGVWERIRRR